MNRPMTRKDTVHTQDVEIVMEKVNYDRLKDKYNILYFGKELLFPLLKSFHSIS